MTTGASRPRRVKCGLHTYPVRYVTGPIEDSRGRAVLCGSAIHNPAAERRIVVSADMSDDEAETLFHEVMHAIVLDRGIEDLIIDTPGMDTVEHVVSQLSRGIVALLRENRGLGAYLTGGR